MKTLSKESVKRYYFVKDNVIFDMGTQNQEGDVCGLLVGEDIKDTDLPKLTVTPDSGVQTTYFLDTLIKDGDKLTKENDTYTFKHITHGATEETETKYCDYYLELCNEQIKYSIKNNLMRDYSYFSKDLKRLGIPMWMIKDNGYTVEPSEGASIFEQITFNEDVFNEIREQCVVEMALYSANNKAMTYGYKVLNTTLDIEKIS